MSKTNPRPEMYRGRVWNGLFRVWEFHDGSGTIITEEVQRDREDSHKNNPYQTFEAVRRLFKPSDFEKRKRK